MEEMVRSIVKETIAELVDQGFLKRSDRAVCQEIGARLEEYYRTEKPSQRQSDMEAALETIRSDPYFNIIPLYFKDDDTLENIAWSMKTEVSTVSRNKKRLCLALDAALRELRGKN